MRGLIDWLDFRASIRTMAHNFLDRFIPPGVNWAYTLGSATTVTFIIMVLSGMLLMIYYQPSPQVAYESVVFIQKEVFLGGFIRNLHHWAASAMVILVLLHMLRTFYWGAYKFPRELTWLSGAFLLLLVLAFAFTGYLLPWDQTAYWTTVLFGKMSAVVPVVGDTIREWILGGRDVGSYTLTRWYAFHVILLPLATMALIVFHISLVVRQGISNPPSRVEPYATAPDPQRAYLDYYEQLKKKGQPFYHNVLEDAIVSLVVVVALVIMAMLFPAKLGEPADPVSTGFVPRPEWYFFWLFQALWYFPGRWELVGVVGIPTLIGILLLILPFVDHNPRRHPLSRPFTVIPATVLLAVVVWLNVQGANAPNTAGLDPTARTSVPKGYENLNEAQKVGWSVFQDQGCISCHAIKGAGGQLGPDLAGIAGRRDEDYLRRWIRNPQAIKPGVAMPPYPNIPEDRFNSLIEFIKALE